MGRGRLSFRVLAVAALLAAASAAPTAFAKEAPPDTIIWYVQPLPPLFSYVGGKAPRTPAELGNGELDGLLKLLISQMPKGIKHEFVESGLARFEVLARQGGAYCTIFHVRTPERLQWLYFTHLLPPPEARDLHVIVRRDRMADFSSDGRPLQLSELLRRRDLHPLFPRDRSFGPTIDAILQSPGTPPLQTVALGHAAQLMAMLRAGRMDYMLEYPMVVDEFQRQTPPSASEPELVKLPVSEGRSTQLATGACSRSPAGLRAVEVMDDAARALARNPRREALLRAWRGTISEADRQRFIRYLDERAKSGPQIE